ncbi:hypothetical protein F7725_016608 [Dissostichus mawsoni]|uniref:Uncharacterized protein n=1 Tax=Dissostichus mawsoni TaxID=36200 RepID=A0A7J5Z239_DISMA|nr:hypothetical protein F7725_016608 [Dissostichus mawsoni]
MGQALSNEDGNVTKGTTQSDRRAWLQGEACEEVKQELQEARSTLLHVPLPGAYSQKPQHHQVKKSPNDRQPHQNVHEAKRHIGGSLRESISLLQGHKIPKSDGGERDEAVVISVKEGPVLKMGEGCGSDTQGAHARQQAHQHHVPHGHLGLLEAQALLGSAQEEADEGVDPLAQALEHDQGQRMPRTA